MAGSKIGLAAASLLANERLSAPAHFDAEVYSAFRRHFRQGLMSRPELDRTVIRLVTLAVERVELPEVQIERGRVNDQNPQDLRPTVAERVRHASGHQREPATLDPMIHVFDMECERSVEDVKGLTGTWMAMRRRPPRTYGDLALEEREPTVGVGP